MSKPIYKEQLAAILGLKLSGLRARMFRGADLPIWSEVWPSCYWQRADVTKWQRQQAKLRRESIGIADLAQQMGRTVTAIRSAIQRERGRPLTIPAGFKLGNEWRWRKVDVQRFLRSKQEQGK